uniref:Odorant receptor n=1 Tax=Meteorus pulchricornis TaxID=51522 RepID=A0A1S5VFT8_9HYME|nr:olfactory receptor 98 [Meteorus pulchricornis]
MEIENSEKNGAVSFAELLEWDVYILRLMGMPSMIGIFSQRELNGKWWEGGPVLIICGILITICMLQVHTISRVFHDEFSYVVVIGASIVPDLTSIVKIIRLWTKRVELYNILQGIGVMWEFTRSTHSITTEMAETARRTKLLTKYYAIGVGVMCIVYMIQPYSLTLADYSNREINDSFTYSANVFPFNFPYKIDSFTVYIISVTYQQLGAVAVCIIWASCDTLYAQITFHVSVQFMVLANTLQEIVNNCGNSCVDRKIEIELKNIIRKYHQLFTCCNSIQIFFNPIIFFSIMSNAISLCCCAYRLNTNVTNGHWEEMPKEIFALISISAQTMIFCICADTLTDSVIMLTFLAFY